MCLLFDPPFQNGWLFFPLLFMWLEMSTDQNPLCRPRALRAAESVFGLIETLRAVSDRLSALWAPHVDVHPGYRSRSYRCASSRTRLEANSSRLDVHGDRYSRCPSGFTCRWRSWQQQICVIESDVFCFFLFFSCMSIKVCIKLQINRSSGWMFPSLTSHTSSVSTAVSY